MSSPLRFSFRFFKLLNRLMYYLCMYMQKRLCCILSYKQQLTILRQRPQLVGYHKFELVDAVTDVLHLWLYCVMISYCLLTLRLYAVGNLTCVDEFFYQFFYSLCTLSYLFNNLDIASAVGIDLFLGEDVLHTTDILCQTSLIVGGNRDDMVHGEVAEHTCLYLYLLGIGLPLHLIACLQLFAVHHAKALKHTHGIVVEVAVEVGLFLCCMFCAGSHAVDAFCWIQAIFVMNSDFADTVCSAFAISSRM